MYLWYTLHILYFAHTITYPGYLRWPRLGSRCSVAPRGTGTHIRLGDIPTVSPDGWEKLRSSQVPVSVYVNRTWTGPKKKVRLD